MNASFLLDLHPKLNSSGVEEQASRKQIRMKGHQGELEMQMQQSGNAHFKCNNMYRAVRRKGILRAYSLGAVTS